MLFHVRMIVRLPHDMPAEKADELKAREKAIAQGLQCRGEVARGSTDAPIRDEQRLQMRDRTIRLGGCGGPTSARPIRTACLHAAHAATRSPA